MTTRKKGVTVAKALGQLPNAPLIYVLAQIRFTHVPRMDKRWEDFHEQVFAAYPKAEIDRIEQFDFKDGQPMAGDTIKRWRLTNEARTTGILLDAGVLVFHTTDYQTSNIFLSDLQHVLAAFVGILPDKGVSFSRLGLRYIDLLLQEGSLSVDQQVIETLRLPKLPADIGQAGRMEQTITCQPPGGGTLIIRHRQSVTPDVLPSDIFPNKLELPARLERERPENTIVGLLDYDHFIEDEQAFDVEAIIAGFKDLRKVSSAAFKATTTKEACVSWKKEF